jgi:hypothetical protein
MNRARILKTCKTANLLPSGKVRRAGAAASLLALALFGTTGVRALDFPVYRVQLAITTADTANAGTDDLVIASLNSNNLTALDYIGNDFKRNSTVVYDLSLDHISTINDISRIKIAKAGTDGLTFGSFSLYVNNAWVMSSRIMPAKSLDSSDPDVEVSYSKSLSLTMPSAAKTLPTGISESEMYSRLQSILGTAIHDTDFDLEWGSGGLSFSKKDSNEIEVAADIDATTKVYGVTFHLSIDLTFDLRFSCSGSELSIEARNVYTDVHGAGLASSTVEAIVNLLGLHDKINDTVSSTLTGGLPNVTLSTPVCPGITINSDGSVTFDW